MADALSLEGIGLNDVRRVGAAILFLQAGMYTLDSYSTLNSSPWTAESFGGDPAKLDALKEYVTHAAVYSTAYCTASAVLAPPGLRIFPIAGAVINNAYLIWLYRRAAGRARASGSAAWSDSGVSRQSGEAAMQWPKLGMPGR